MAILKCHESISQEKLKPMQLNEQIKTKGGARTFELAYVVERSTAEPKSRGRGGDHVVPSPEIKRLSYKRKPNRGDTNKDGRQAHPQVVDPPPPP